MWHCIHKPSAPSAANGAFSLASVLEGPPDPAPRREAVKGTWTGWLVDRQHPFDDASDSWPPVTTVLDTPCGFIGSLCTATMLYSYLHLTEPSASSTLYAPCLSYGSVGSGEQGMCPLTVPSHQQMQDKSSTAAPMSDFWPGVAAVYVPNNVCC